MPIVLSGLPSGILSQVSSRRRPIWLARGHGKYRRSELAHCADMVSERLRGWTRNPSGAVRRIRIPSVSLFFWR
jgi:hypothetical protein